MAHLMESMMYAGDVPWHGLGKKVDSNLNTAEAIKAAGLDWKVNSAPLFTGSEFGSQQVTHRAIIRETDKSVLGIVGPEYIPLQNQTAFNFFDPYIKAEEASIDTAGSLRKGQNIWVLAKLNRAPIEVVKGDPVEKFLLLSNSHKGGIAVRVGFTPIRVVCANTLAMAHSAKGSQLIRVIHGRQMENNLEKIQEVVSAANAQFEATAEQYKYLASRQVSKADLETYVKVIFKTNGSKNERLRMREEKMIQTITRIFETGKGNQQKGVSGTYWALYNGVTEYLSHEQQTSAEKRINNIWFGSGVDRNRESLEVAVKMARGV